MKEYKFDLVRNGMYNAIIDTINLEEAISSYFDYILRLDIADYNYFLNFLSDKYTHKAFEIIVSGILQNMNTLINLTFDELDRERNFRNKTHILNVAKQLKFKERIINNFYMNNLRSYKEYTKKLKKQS